MTLLCVPMFVESLAQAKRDVATAVLDGADLAEIFRIKRQCIITFAQDIRKSWRTAAGAALKIGGTAPTGAGSPDDLVVAVVAISDVAEILCDAIEMENACADGAAGIDIGGGDIVGCNHIIARDQVAVGIDVDAGVDCADDVKRVVGGSGADTDLVGGKIAIDRIADIQAAVGSRGRHIDGHGVMRADDDVEIALG